MKCKICGKEKQTYEFMKDKDICITCFYNDVRTVKIKSCPTCGREFSKWRFCLECGHINHRYTNKNYIGEGE